MVVLLYALNDYDAACAVVWLEQHMRDRGDALPGRAVLQAQIMSLYNQCNPAVVAAVAARVATSLNSAEGRAHQFFADWRLGRWVEMQNTDHGLAVSTQAVRDHAAGPAAHGEGAGAHAAPGALRSLTGRERMWALRWRRNLGVFLCKAQQRDVVPLPVMQSKVRFFCTRS